MKQFIFYNEIADKLIVVTIIVAEDEKAKLKIIKSILNNHKYIGEL